MLVAEPAQFQAIVSRSVRLLISKGSRSMRFIRWNGFALIPTAAVVVCGGFLLNNQTNAQPRQDIEQDRKAASAGAKSETVNSAATRPESLVIPVIREAAAAAGRGKVLVYALDAKGRRIPGEPVPAKRRRRRREPADQKGDRLLNGPPAPERPDKEVIVDMSWAVVTGVVDQRVIEQRLANGDRVGQLWAEQVYRRVDLERQERSATDRWSDWRAVDPEPTIQIFDNLPEYDQEMTPPELRLTNLVDPLPRLKAGKWTGVDVDRFVPAVHQEIPAPPPGNAVRRVPEPPLPPLLMLRQFDFAVQPGHTYRYRAAGRRRLAMAKDGTRERLDRAHRAGDRPLNRVRRPVNWCRSTIQHLGGGTPPCRPSCSCVRPGDSPDATTARRGRARGRWRAGSECESQGPSRL